MQLHAQTHTQTHTHIYLSLPTDSRWPFREVLVMMLRKLWGKAPPVGRRGSSSGGGAGDGGDGDTIGKVPLQPREPSRFSTGGRVSGFYTDKPPDVYTERPINTLRI